MELNENTYETYCLLYIDNELSPSERIAVERFAASQSNYAAILQVLQNSVLPIAKEVFEDKTLLYRFEEMEATLDPEFKKTLYKKEAEPTTATASVISLWNQNILRYSAIAALFILTIGTAIKFTTHKSEVNNVSAQNIIPATRHIAGMNSYGNVATSKSIINNQTSQLIIPNIHNSLPVEAIKNSVSLNNNASFETASKALENTNIASSSNKTLDNNNILVNNTIHAAAAIEALASIEKEPINRLEEHAPVNQNTNQTESFEEINTNDSDRIIYISSIEIDSDKIRGFTRRINAIFKRNKSDKQ